MVAAEMTGDARFFEGILADDVVIMPPGIAAIEGAPACLEFIRHVLQENAREFERRVMTHVDAEVSVSGDVAFDRGSFSQTLTPLAGGDEIHEQGQYLRVYARAPDGSWRIARVIWNNLFPPEAEAGQDAPTAPSAC